MVRPSVKISLWEITSNIKMCVVSQKWHMLTRNDWNGCLFSEYLVKINGSTGPKNEWPQQGPGPNRAQQKNLLEWAQQRPMNLLAYNAMISGVRPQNFLNSASVAPMATKTCDKTLFIAGETIISSSMSKRSWHRDRGAELVGFGLFIKSALVCWRRPDSQQV